MTNELLKIDWKDEAMIKTMRDTVAKGASDEEFKLFCAIAQSTGLNPFLKQIWFIKGNKYQSKKGDWVQPPAQIMTGIDGYRAIANTNTNYDGTEIITDRDKDGKPTRCIAKVYRKDRRFPGVAEVMFREYYKPGFNGNQSTWDKNPTVMLEKVAESLATRRAFPLEVGSIRTFEEMGIDETSLTDEDKENAINIDPEPDPRVFYDLSMLEEKSRGSAQKYLEANFCSFDDDRSIWIAPRKLEKLSSCIVDIEAFEEKKRLLSISEDIKAREDVAQVSAEDKIAALKAQLVTADSLNQ